MRDFKGMKRQRGRNRGGGGSSPGGKPQQNANRAFDSNGPDNIKVRGHAQHVFEKYQQLARDATSGGDRVLAENFLQHAEHYFRVLRTLQPNRPVADFIARDSFSGYDIDFEDESGAQALPDEQPPAEGQGDAGAESGEQPRGDYPSREGRWENRQNSQGERGPREDRPRDDRPRDDRPRDDRPRDDRPREDRPRDDRPREDRPREDRAPREGRDRDRSRFDRGPREDRPRDDRGYRAEGQEGEGQAQGQGQGQGGFRDRDRAYRDDRPPREDRFRDDRPRDDRPRDDRTRDDRPREERRERSDPLAVVEPQAQPLTAQSPTVEASAPPPASVPAPSSEGASMLRSSDGETSHAPAFLQAAAAPAPSGEAAPVKRPRGRPRKVKEEAPQTEEV